MARTTEAPAHRGPRRLTAWFAATVLATVAAVVGVGAPTPAAAGDTYTPRCYYLCLVFNPSAPNVYASITAYTYRYDVGPTPYYISIFNHQTGELLATCGTGSTCRTENLFGWDPDWCITYVAYIGGAPYQMPPEPVQMTSNTLERCFGAG
jgi:hypothetical protein